MKRISAYLVFIFICVDRYFVNQKNNSCVIIGGVRMLTDFSPEQIIVAVNGAQINTVGQNLKIARFDENEIEIIGKIENVETILSRKRSF